MNCYRLAGSREYGNEAFGFHAAHLILGEETLASQ